MGDTIDSLQIYINSRYAETNLDYTGSNQTYKLPYILAPDGHYIHISVVNAVIPMSFNNITTRNNTVICIETYPIIPADPLALPPVVYQDAHDEEFTMIIPSGNYNANQMSNQLTTGYWAATNPLYPTPHLKVTYNSITNTFLFKNTLDQNFKFTLPYTTCIEPLGLSTNVLYNTSIFGQLTSYNAINLATVRAINIVTNYSSGNLSILEQNNFNTLASIPVIALPNSLIYYVNSNDFKTNLYLGEINNISIKLTDQDNNSLHLNGLYYNMTLQIDILRFN